ncbi:unnamed protein product, partial [Ectocarpus sp. 12 AP-2014]
MPLRFSTLMIKRVNSPLQLWVLLLIIILIPTRLKNILRWLHSRSHKTLLSLIDAFLCCYLSSKLLSVLRVGSSSARFPSFRSALDPARPSVRRTRVFHLPVCGPLCVLLRNHLLSQLLGVFGLRLSHRFIHPFVLTAPDTFFVSPNGRAGSRGNGGDFTFPFGFHGLPCSLVRSHLLPQLARILGLAINRRRHRSCAVFRFYRL